MTDRKSADTHRAPGFHELRLVQDCGFAPGHVAPLCSACSSGDVDLGDGLITRDLTRPSRCAESVRIEGDIFVENQGQLEELTGCEELDVSTDSGVRRR